MAILQKNKKNLSWIYFFTLVKELEVVSNYIEFEETNYKTYSIELAKLLMETSSEIDVVLKQLCNKIKPEKEHKNIKHYRETIKEKLNNNFLNEKVYITRHGLELDPWSNWRNSNENPDWWKAYNGVKHLRNEKFSDANLKNVLNALSALFVSILYLSAIDDIYPNLENLTNSLSYAIERLEPKEGFIQMDSNYYS